MEHFTYLGSTLSRSANIDVEVNNRIAKASSAFERLRKTVWGRRGISQITKIKLYMVVVLTTLLKPSTGDTKNNSSSSIFGVFAASSTSAGKTRSLTPRC